jgi:hypothetical protein
MTPDAARRMAQHGRRLLTARIISPTDYAVLDALLWRCRRPGRSDLAVDYRSIARLAGVCRDTAIGAVRKLADIGLIQKIRRRVNVRWGRGRECLASRAIANGYIFRPPQTESARQTADRGDERFLPSIKSTDQQKSARERALSLLAGAIGGADGWTDQRAIQSGNS